MMISQILSEVPTSALIGIWLSLCGVAVYLTSLTCIPWVIDRFLNCFNGGVSWQGAAIPGPRWKWSIGQFEDKFMNGHDSSEAWRQYGPVYRIWAGAQPEIVLTTPEDIRTFHSDSAEHGKPLNGHWGWFFGQLLGRCVGLIEYDEWKNMRRIVDPPFRHSAVASRVALTNADAKDFVETLAQTGVAGDEKVNPDRFSIHAATSFMKFPFFFASEAVYGRMTDSEKERLWGLAEKRLALTPFLFKGAGHRTPWFKWWDAAAYRQLRDFTDNWSVFNKEMADKRKEQGVPAPISDYYDELQQGKATKEEILHTIDEMLFANLDVTTHVLTWAIILAAEHPEIKQALREEIAANMDNLEEYIAKTNTHLHRCFYESLRVRPLTVFSIGECAPTVKNFRGILVKPKTMVLVDTLAINVRNPFWGPDRSSYNPDRFKTIKQTELRYNLFAFGFGHRKCLGQHLAAHMVKSIMAHLFSRYEVRVKAGRSSTKGGDEYVRDKNFWVPVGDVTIELNKLGSEVE